MARIKIVAKRRGEETSSSEEDKEQVGEETSSDWETTSGEETSSKEEEEEEVVEESKPEQETADQETEPVKEIDSVEAEVGPEAEKEAEPEAEAAEQVSDSVAEINSTEEEEVLEQEPGPSGAGRGRGGGVKRKTPPTSGAGRKPKRRLGRPTIHIVKPTGHQRDKATLNTRPTEILEVYVSGTGPHGELGLGASERGSLLPTERRRPYWNDLLSEEDVVQIAAGGRHGIALTTDSRVLTWGCNDEGALGRVTAGENRQELEWTPTTIPLEAFGEHSETLCQVIGTDHACFVLTASGNVFGWGTFHDKEGLFGFRKETAALTKGTEAPTNDDDLRVNTPMLIPELIDIIKLAGGRNHVVALDRNGRCMSWGINDSLQLGIKTKITRSNNLTFYDSLNPRPIVSVNRNKLHDINCGYDHSFSIDQKQFLNSWGLNEDRQTGHSKMNKSDMYSDLPRIERPTHARKTKLGEFIQIAGGQRHSIGLLKDGRLVGWGRCDQNQMGTEIPDEKLCAIKDANGDSLKIAVTPIILDRSVITDDVVHIAAGQDVSIAVTSKGDVYSWGVSEDFRRGSGDEKTAEKPTLLTVPDDQKITFAACGKKFLYLAGPKSPT